MSTEAAVQRLRRILVMVPWIIAHPDTTVQAVCARFGVAPEDLSADLDLLVVCGLPPFGPGDLVEAFIEGDRVSITMAEYLQRPPRLTRAEAVALLVMGRALTALPGGEHSASLRSGLEKLAGAITPAEAGRATETAQRIAVELGSAGTELLAVVRDAVAERVRLDVAYYSQGRGEMTERAVDPLLVFNAMGNWYVVAFDHDSGEERTFRLDRIKEARSTGATFEPPAGFDADHYRHGPVFTPSARDREVVIEVTPAAAWLTEVLPYERAQDTARGVTRIILRTAHLAWLVRLLLTTGPAARAERPPELIEAVRDAARAALKRYSS